MLSKIPSILISLCLLLSSHVFAQKVDSNTYNSIAKALSEKVPNLPKIDEIQISPVTGIYEVRHSGAEIFYTTADGSYIFQGALIDTKNKKNLTTDKINLLSNIDFKSLPLKDAFTIVKGQGKRKIAVFEDPNCGYCKQFEKEIQNLENVTIYLFLYPILGADSINKSNDIWCSKDKKKTWVEWMANGVKIPEAKCLETPISRNIALGKKLKINGTPTLIFEDGTKVPGVMSINQIEEKLKQNKK